MSNVKKETSGAPESLEEREPIISIDGTKREVKYPVMSVMKMEQALGCSSLVLLQKDVQNPFSIRELVVILWAGLLVSLPKVTIEKVTRLVEDPDFDFDFAIDICKQELFESLTQILRVNTGEDSKN